MSKIIDYNVLQPTIDELLDQKETNEVEFKSAAGGFPGTFWSTYSSFANTNGGLIVFGVKEKNDQFLLDGLTDAQIEKYKKEFFSAMHNKNKVNVPLLSDKDVEVHEVGDCKLLYFYVPRADRSIRPVYCGLDPYTGSYRRDNEGDYHCSREEVNSMFADANIDKSVDGRIMTGFTIDDLDKASIMQYRRLFEVANPHHVWIPLTDEEFLEKLNVIRKDRSTGERGLTFAGLLMFGTYSALVDADPNFFPDYKEVGEGNDRWINRICPDGNWESNLFQFYRKTLSVLQGFLPQPFKLEGNIRVSETPAHVSVREGLTNSLVHADYTLNLSLKITKYADKIVISNPGTMLVSKAIYYKGGESKCRNKYLQTMFGFLGSAEKAGSGADKIIKGWTLQNWKKPYIEEEFSPNVNRVTLTMPLESLFDEDTKAAMHGILGDRMDTLPREQLLALAHAYSEEEISNDRLQYVLSMHRTDISHMLKEMCDNDLLVSTGYGRGTKYHIANESNLCANKNNLSTDKSNLTRRYKKEDLIQMIADFCVDWKTVEEIAAYVGRDSKYLNNKIMPLLDKLLDKQYNVPHHPKQKYKRKDQ